MLPAATTSTSADLARAAGEVEAARGEVEAPALLPGPRPGPARFPSAHTPRTEVDDGEVRCLSGSGQQKAPEMAWIV
jgi:hypothetical protein